MPDSRLELWRRSIALFHEFKTAHWTGPFFLSGYKASHPSLPSYVVCRNFLDGGGRSCKPDIVSSSAGSWSVIELTLDDSSKEQDLNRYSGIPSNQLGNYGLVGPRTSPVVFSARLSQKDDGPFPSLILADTMSTHNLSLVNDTTLRTSLERAQGLSLLHVPEIPISFVPESQPWEIRVGLVDFIMKVFEPGSQGLKITDIVDQGLDRLSSAVSVTDKEKLAKLIEAELRGLLTSKWGLHEDLVLKEGLLKVANDLSWHPRSLERVQRSIRAWAYRDSPERGPPLERYDGRAHKSGS